MESLNQYDIKSLDQPLPSVIPGGCNKPKIFSGFERKKGISLKRFQSCSRPVSVLNKNRKLPLKHHIPDMDGYEINIYLR